MRIFLWSGNEESGPFSREEIFAKLKEGSVRYETPARMDDDPEWSTLEQILSRGSAGLFSIDQIVSAQAAPSPAPIPEVLPCVPDRLENRTPKKSRKLPILAAVLALATAGGLLIFRGSDECPQEAPMASPELEAIAVEPVGRPVISETPAAIAQQATPAPLLKAAAVTPAARAKPPRVESPAADLPAATPEPQLASLARPADTTPASSPASSPKNPTASDAKPVPLPSPSISQQATVKDFFKIASIKLLKKESRDGVGVWSTKVDPVTKVSSLDKFQTCLEVQVSVGENIRSDRTIARIHFFDQDNKRLGGAYRPSKSGKFNDRVHFEMPVLLRKEEPARFFFEVPAKIRNQKWKAVVVFGDRHELHSLCYPLTESDFMLEYSEKARVHDRTAPKVTRKPAMDPLIEHVVRTRNPQMPQITLFLRPPRGIGDASEIKGVMAVCVLANSVDSLKRELQREEMTGDYDGLFAFANKEKLAILAWGARTLWDAGRNYDQLTKDETRAVDRSLDLVAGAWERGVQELSEKYGIPSKNFLLWGSCGSAQWVARLCLRKPEFFLATYIHMPGSYDKPTPEAARVLWCLTIGEREAGYERSKRFVEACRPLGYPMLYKAIVGLGHAGHPDATALSFEFFRFALQRKEARERLDADQADRLAAQAKNDGPAKPWLEDFSNPPFYGDMVNQEVYPADQIDMIPEGFRVPLPSKKLMDIWARSK